MLVQELHIRVQPRRQPPRGSRKSFTSSPRILKYRRPGPARDIDDSSSPGPRPGRSRDPGARTGPIDREIDELTAAEEAFPEIVSLAFGHDQADGVPGAGGLVAGNE